MTIAAVSTTQTTGWRQNRRSGRWSLLSRQGCSGELSARLPTKLRIAGTTWVTRSETSSWFQLFGMFYNDNNRQGCLFSWNSDRTHRY